MALLETDVVIVVIQSSIPDKTHTQTLGIPRSAKSQLWQTMTQCGQWPVTLNQSLANMKKKTILINHIGLVKQVENCPCIKLVPSICLSVCLFASFDTSGRILTRRAPNRRVLQHLGVFIIYILIFDCSKILHRNQCSLSQTSIRSTYCLQPAACVHMTTRGPLYSIVCYNRECFYYPLF